MLQSFNFVPSVTNYVKVFIMTYAIKLTWCIGHGHNHTTYFRNRLFIGKQHYSLPCDDSLSNENCDVISGQNKKRELKYVINTGL